MRATSLMTGPTELQAIVLAGDRGPADPIAAHCGVAGKALAPVAGRPMLVHVLDALAELPGLATVVLVCPRDAAYARAAHATRLPPEKLRLLPAEASPSASAAAALDTLPADSEVLLVTADHPLLLARWLVTLLQEARERRAELGTALVPLQRVQDSYPRNRRTRLAFADGAMCGANLFVFRSPRSRRVAVLWQQLERQRKRPWRMVAWLGAGNLLRYLAGRMTRRRAFELLSARAGVGITAVLLDDAEAAVDVDTLDDLRLVERIVADRAAHAAH